jgi:hypothetical protein
MINSLKIFIAAIFLMLVADCVLAQNFWQPVGLDSQDVGALAINSNGHIFAGCSGVFRSTDNGGNWTQIGLSRVYTLALTSTGALLAGVWLEGVYRSSDDGAHWTNVLSVTYPLDFSISLEGHIFFAAARGDYAPSPWIGGGIYRSTDDGQSWDSLAGYSTSAICVNQSNHIFALALPIDQFGTAIFHSTDNGMNWTFLQMLDSTAYGWPMDIAVSSNGNVYCALYPNDNGVFRSTNSGNIWEVVLTNLSTSELAINANGSIFAGTRGDGVFRSTNDGVEWESINEGLTSLWVGSLAVSPEGYIFAGTDVGVFRSLQPTTSANATSYLLPASFVLYQNYPNPFNPSTKIKYSLPQSSKVTLKVFDVLGKEVAVLVDEVKSRGVYEINWNAESFPSGVYFYQIKAGDFIETKKMILMK